ncbi:MAG: Spo0E family sporulation regulatory protein-aspartic acid phosphatase [Bacillota bacterium]|jgi:hypothetical protein
MLNYEDKQLCRIIEEERRKFENLVQQCQFNFQDENIIRTSCYLDKFIVSYYNSKKEKKLDL